MLNLRMSTTMKLLTTLLCALAVVLGAARPALAHEAEPGHAADAPHGQIALRADAPGAPVELAADGADFTGAAPDINEAERLGWIPFDEIQQHIDNGTIVGAGSVSGLLVITRLRGAS